MQIKYLNRDIIFLFLLCQKVPLNFSLIQKLYLCQSEVFWNYLIAFFPGLKIGDKKLIELSKVADRLYFTFELSDKVEYIDPIEFTKEELYSYNCIKMFHKNVFECEGELYDLEDVTEYVDNYLDRLPDTEVSILLDNGSTIKENVNTILISNIVKNIDKIAVGSKVFTKTSHYKVRLNEELAKGIDENLAVKITLEKIKKELLGLVKCEQT